MFFGGSANVSQSTVVHVQASDFESKVVLCRENGMLFYGPESNSRNQNYEVVMPIPISMSVNKALSLYRTSEKDVAKSIFDSYKSVIPYFMKITKKNVVEVLQKVCDVMRENPLCSVAHVAVLINAPHVLKDPPVKVFIDDKRTGHTPVMEAIKSKNLETVKELISLGCCLNTLDVNGKSVLHYACMYDEIILKYLLSETNCQDLINVSDLSGKTAVYYACINNQANSIDLLVIFGANIDGDKSGTKKTLLHYCNSVAILHSLIKENLDINQQDDDGCTPLHSFVTRKNHDCVLHALLYGADPNIEANGVFPLHCAVTASDPKSVKTLVVFGANVNPASQNLRHMIKANESDSSKIVHILHSVGSKRCPTHLPTCTDYCSPNGCNDGAVSSVELRSQNSEIEQLFNTIAMEKNALENRRVNGGRLLSLDGGGIRGLVLIKVLQELEKIAQKPIINCFDWVAGTSTGGIIALALSLGKSLKDCQRLYFQMKDEVFQGSMPYSSEKLEALIKEHIGENITLCNVKTPKLMITSVICTRNPFDLHIHRNYPSPEAIIKRKAENAPLIDIPVWKVARATSAAPFYFDPMEKFMDGGLLANNPTLDALTEIFEYGLALRVIGSHETVPFASVVVSCGTGVSPISNNFPILPTLMANMKNYKKNIISTGLQIFSFFKDISNIIVELICGADGRFVDRARAWCCTAGVPYYRFNPPLSYNVSMDETSDDIIIEMLWETTVYMYNNRILVKEVVDCLMQK